MSKKYNHKEKICEICEKIFIPIGPGQRYCVIHNWKSPYHNLWNTINQRCYRTSGISYKNYGGRGIKVYPSWKSGEKDAYRKFVKYLIEAIGERPNPKACLDRIDNNGNYEPNNLRWSTYSENLMNKRTTILSGDINIDMQPIKESAIIASKYGLTLYQLGQFLKRVAKPTFSDVYSRKLYEISKKEGII